jgi:hypothetical protein
MTNKVYKGKCIYTKPVKNGLGHDIQVDSSGRLAGKEHVKPFNNIRLHIRSATVKCKAKEDINSVAALYLRNLSYRVLKVHREGLHKASRGVVIPADFVKAFGDMDYVRSLWKINACFWRRWNRNAAI